MARPPKGTPNKSDFVRGLPAELSAAQVVEKAKEAGLTITPIFVYKVRSRDKAPKAPKVAAKAPQAPKAVAKAPKVPKAAAKVAAKAPKKTGKPAAAPAPAAGGFKTASDYIRAQPVGRPVAEIVAEGRGLGLKVSPSLVYTLIGQKRRGQPGSKKQVAAPAKRGKAAPKAKVEVAEAPAGAKSQFRKLVLDLGVARAKALVADVEKRIRALVTGG